MKIADLFAALKIDVDQKSLDKVDATLGKIKTGLKRLTLAAGAGATALGVMVTQTTNAADRFKRLEGEVGVSSESMQQLGFAAETMGLELDNVVDFIGDLNEKAVEATEGNEDLQKSFKTLGLRVKDSNGDIKDAETLATDMADAFANLEDGPKKTQLAMKLFSDEGRKMIPLLNLGSEGIRELRDEFAESGAQINQKDTKALREYGRTMVKLRTVVTGFKNQAVIALLPHLKSASKNVLAWVKANRAMLKQNLLKFMKALFVVLKLVFKGVGFVVKNGERLVRLFVAWKIAVLALAAAQAIAAAGGVAAAAATAAAWLVATAPLLLMIALFAVIVLIIEDFIAFLTGKESVIGDVWNLIVEAWRSVLQSFFDWLEEKLQKINNAVQSVLKIPRKLLAKAGLAVDFDRKIKGRLVPGTSSIATPEEGPGTSLPFRPDIQPDLRPGQGVIVNQSIVAPDPETAGRLSAEGVAREIQAATPR